MLNENQLQHGANYTPKDPTITLLKNVAGDSAPFDWVLGADVTRTTGELPTKNQAGSFSCGGQAGGYISEVIARLNNPIFKEKSARFIYSQIVSPGGGSSDVDIINFLTSTGVCDEELYPSYYYIGGNKACDEAWMTNKIGITPDIKDNAKKTFFGKPMYVKRTLEDLSKAVRDQGGVIIGIIGQNNGTWLSADPKPPVGQDNLWYHWLYIGKGITRKGQQIGGKQSWGEPIGENGWQYFGSEWMPFIFSAFTFGAFDPKPNFTHTFNINLQLGDKNDEVKALQDALKLDGVFPANQLSTGYFGQMTLAAVKAFQKKEQITPVSGYVGTKTRAMLNIFYS